MVEGGKYIAWLKQSKYDRTPTESNCTSSSTSAHVKYKLHLTGNANRPEGANDLAILDGNFDPS
jgi:hypothetical protein